MRYWHQRTPERFLQEARTVARLNHPHIVRVLDYEVHDTTPFLCDGLRAEADIRARHIRAVACFDFPRDQCRTLMMAAALQHAP